MFHLFLFSLFIEKTVTHHISISGKDWFEKWIVFFKGNHGLERIEKVPIVTPAREWRTVRMVSAFVCDPICKSK